MPGARAASPASPVRKYRLNSRKTPMVLAVLFFGAVGGFLGWRSLTNDRGLILNGVITFDTEGASIFYAVLAVTSLLFVGAGGIALVRQFGEPQWLTLDQHAVSGPRSVINATPVRIPYSEIANVKLFSYRGQTGAEIRARDRRKIWLGTKSFEHDDMLDEFLEELGQRVAEASRI